VFRAVKICVVLFALWRHVVTAGVLPQRHQLETLVSLTSLGDCAKSCVRRSVCFCSQSGVCASVLPLT
jgi:hypothetical protein